MYVCICLAVTDVDVKRAIDEGAECVSDVTRACKAGGDCGACRGTIEDMLDEAVDSGRRPLPLYAPTRAA